ncbi:T9SS type B sorting domain-containing protein [Flavilitoribacter nigricans]|uniref:T9SS type B sorting domain-containing protein n=1 Tax=Flavilitoribacter nigricans TaxID=70997 RepID=UPI0014753A5B|nr:gliding motility-associated C-terminal domain-containing protein [Flavilitoribacter nigricans]
MQPILVRSLFFVLALMAGTVAYSQPTMTYIVTKTVDTNGSCDAGDCSLREAINAANSDGTASNIRFAFSAGAAPYTIFVRGTPLPPITGADTQIDGLVGNGYSLGDVIVDGSLLAGTVDGFSLMADNAGISGLRIQNFTGNGINAGVTFATISCDISNSIIVDNGNNGILIPINTDLVVDGSYIGTDPSFSSGLGNGGSGINYTSLLPGIPTLDVTDNAIASNGSDAIRTDGQVFFNISSNVIGTNPAGTLFLGNSASGVFITNNTSRGSITNNTIAFNTWGIRVPASIPTAISRNSLFCNFTAGILRMFSPITLDITTASLAEIAGTSSIGGGTVEVFIQDPNCPAGTPNPCQGRTFVGVTTSAADGSWSLNVAGSVSNGDVVTATITTNAAFPTTSNYAACQTISCGVILGNIDETPSCVGGNSGSLTANPTGGDAPYNYQWSNGGTSQTISNLPPGVYTVTIEDVNGCLAVDSGDVLEIPGPTANAGPDQTICSGESTTLSATATGGTGPYTFLWEPGGAGTTITVSPTESTVYNVTATDTQGCEDVDQVIVRVVAAPQPPDAGPDQSLCAGETASLQGTIGGDPAGPGVWSASVAGGTFSPDANTLDATYTPPAGATTVTLTLTTTNGTAECPNLSDDMIITYTAAPTLDAGPDQAICAGEEITLTAVATGGAGSYTFQWEPGGAGASITVSPATTTIYDVTVTDAQGCTDTDRVQVSVNPSPATPDAGPDQSLCVGETASLQGTIGGDPAAPGLWSASVAGGTFSPDANTLNATYTPPAGATTVTLTLSTTNGTAECPNLTDDMVITYTAAPTLDAGPDQVICAGEEITLTAVATGGAGSYTFQWEPGGAGASITVSPATTTIYDVTVTDAQGCTATDRVQVSVNTSPDAPNAGPDQTLCAGVTANLQGTVGGDPAGPGIWSASVAGGTFTPDANTLNATYTPPAGITTVTLTLTTTSGTAECPNLSDDMIITYTEGVTVDAGPDQTVCTDAPTTLAGVIGGSGVSGGWSASVPGGTFTPDNLDLNAEYTPPTGVTSVVLTLLGVDPTGQCPDVRDQMTITYSENNATVDAGPSQIVCEGQPVDLAGSFGGTATSAQWSTDGDGTFLDSNDPTTAYTPGPNDISGQGATLTLTTNGSAGCPPVSDNMDFRIIPAPDYTVTGINPSTCGDPDGSIVISGLNPGTPYDGSYTFAGAVVSIAQDASAAGEIRVDNLGDGVYTDIVITDGNGCSGPSATVTLSSPGGPGAGANPISICVGNTGEISGLPTGGTEPYTHEWFDQASGSASNYTLSNNNFQTLNIDAGSAQPGTVDLLYQVTDANGCAASAAVTVTILAGPAVAIVQLDSASMAGAADGRAEFSVNGGQPPYDYSWTGPSAGTSSQAAAGNAVVDGLQSGNYSLQLNDANGCSTTVRFRIGITLTGGGECTTDAGSLEEVFGGGVQACSSSPVELVHNGDQFLDPNDALVFVLKEMSGVVIKTYNEPVFTYDPASMSLNTQYLAAARAGNATGPAGAVDPADPCLSESNSVSIIFRESLTGVLNFLQGEEELCQGEELILSTNNLGSVDYFWITPNRDTLRTNEPMVVLPDIQTADAGDYYVMVRDGDCLNDQTGPFTLIVNGLPVGTTICAGDDQTVCERVTSLQACNPGTGTGFWTSLSGARINNSGSANTTVSDLVPGENLFVWTVEISECGSVGSDTVRVVYESALFAQPDAFVLERANTEIFMDVLKNDNIAAGADIELTALTEPAFGILETLPNGFRFYENEQRRGTVEFVYQVCYLGGSCAGACDTATVNIEVLNLPYLPEGITPDGDGRNDELTVLGYTPGDSDLRLQLTIANQWGEIIFQSNDYTNSDPWKGTFKGQPVPQGAYYCHLETIVPEGSFERTQTVYVVR